MKRFKPAQDAPYWRWKQTGTAPPLAPPPWGGEVLAAGRARGQAAKALPAPARKRTGVAACVQGALRRALPALDPRRYPVNLLPESTQKCGEDRWQIRIDPFECWCREDGQLTTNLLDILASGPIPCSHM
jgi:hypothetical protein